MLKIAALVEATYVTGAIKGPLEFAKRARADPQRRCDVTFFAFTRGGNNDNPFISECRRSGIPVVIIEERFPYDVRILRQLRRLITTARPDLIQTHASKSHFLVWLLSLYKQCRWAAFHHGYTRIDRKDIAISRLDRISLRRAHEVFTDCAAFVPEMSLCSVPLSRIHVRHNCVDTRTKTAPDTQRRLKEQFGIADNEHVLLAIGRLSNEKGHVYLLEAVRQICQRPDLYRFRLFIVGDGPERGRLEQHARQAGLDSVVRFTGHQGTVSEWYDISDIFVLPSLSEGSPNVLLEAMVAGLPVVATATGGIPEMVRDGEHALLARPGDPVTLAGNIRLLLSDAKVRRRIGLAAQVRALDFSPRIYAEDMLAELTALMEAP